LLTKEAAQALADESLGRLTVASCPVEDGWHLYAPPQDAE
jgi:hypothetical protein